MPPPANLESFTRAAQARGWSPPFRGTIWENARRYRLAGPAYASMPEEQGGYFDIATANHLRGPLAALADPDVRIVGLIASSQSIKSLAALLWLMFRMEHDPGDALVLFENEDKADDFARRRVMPVIHAHPTLRAKLEAETVDRHDISRTRIVTSSMSLTIGGLNDTRLSSFAYKIGWSSEAWQHTAGGMLRKFITRFDRWANECKILIESRAGRAGEDLHTEVRGMHQVPLTWRCPYCDGAQTWDCTHEYGSLRGQDFSPRKPHTLPEGQLDLWTPPAIGSFSGMKFSGPEQTANGQTRFLTIAERARTAAWECHWCGTLIADTPALRRQIADSYSQDYRIVGEGGYKVAPKTVCFTLPKESNMTNAFEKGVAVYLAAKEAADAGNPVPLEDWYMDERSIFYTPRLSQTRVAVITGSAGDPKDLIPNESIRALCVDCQKDVIESLKQGKDLTGHFWYVAEATDKAGNTFQLERGYAVSWEELFGAGGVKERLKIPTRNVAIDGGNWFDIVKEKAAHYRTREKALDGSGKEVWATWKIMIGDDGKGVRWEDGVWRSYWPPKTYQVDILEGARWVKISVQVTRWSNFAVKSILYKLRLGLPGQPKFVALPAGAVDSKTRAKEAGDFTYENQMNGFVLGEDKNGKPKFIELHKQQHYPDCSCMGIVLKMMKGLVRGEVSVETVSAQEADKK
jgi:Phage terminase large subunit (GpA)